MVDYSAIQSFFTFTACSGVFFLTSHLEMEYNINKVSILNILYFRRQKLRLGTQWSK
jgi:hypothetical protein